MTSQAPMGDVVTSDSAPSFSTGAFKVLYVYSINDKDHEDRLKVGDATFRTVQTLDEIKSESEALDPSKVGSHIIETPGITAAAEARIKQQVGTADVQHTLLWAILAVKPDSKSAARYAAFRDYDVHNVLLRSGIQKRFTSENKKRGEWFDVTLDQVKKAVEALQSGKDAIRSTDLTEIALRPEQNAAVDATLKVFQNGHYDAPREFLWNAIMRFGKTLTSYALIKKLEPEVKRVLIITHRPVVSSGWYEDFDKSFPENSEWSFASKKTEGESWASVKNREKFVYFASMQDLRGSFNIEKLIKSEASIEEDISKENLTDDSELSSESITSDNSESDKEIVSELFTKNEDVFQTDWDLLIFDEGHEGLGTELALKVKDNIRTKYKLVLSGTPFNIIDDFESDNVFTWSYIDEQKASDTWKKLHPDESNPYGSLPKLEIRTYDVSGVFEKHPALDSAKTRFDFGKFFEVDKNTRIIGEVYKDGFHPFANVTAVDQLLNMMIKSDENGVIDAESGIGVLDRKNFPFGSDSSKVDFAHTFWIVPTIDASKALHERLNSLRAYTDFKVVNATANNAGDDTLKTVKNAIKTNKRTITLSVGKLTTGTTIPEWTGILMLSNMDSAMRYMQTIFRVKSSGSLSDGRLKETGYVFDFAPDRSLKLVLQGARASQRVKATDDGGELDFYERQKLEREEVSDVLKYLPIIAYDGAGFTKTDTSRLMKTINRVYISQTVDNGFDDTKLYDFDIHGITADDLKLFEETKKIVGASSKDQSVKNIVIAESQLSKEHQKSAKADKLDRDTNSEDIAKNVNLDLQNAKKLMQILKGVSVRLPMLVFATNPEIEITVENFAEIIDEKSWAEFMPKGFARSGTGVSWESLHKFYNKDVFEGACDEVQARTRRMDGMPVLERIAGIANLFSTFRNVDKETILTPWAVVNRQYSDTLGGLRFVDNDGLWYCKDAYGVSGGYSYSDYLDSKDTVNPLTLDPQWTPVEEDLQKFWDANDTRVLDINSKTALYPLMAAASLWWRTVHNPNRGRRAAVSIESEELTWKEIVENQIFVNCRVPYSASIAQRVLAGYGTARVKASVVDVIEVRKVLKKEKFPELTKGIKGADSNETTRLKEAAIDSAIADIWKWIFNPESIGTRNEDGTMTVAEERASTVLNMAKDKIVERTQALESNETEDVS